MTEESIHGSPLRFSERLGRPIRVDGIDTLGQSTQTLIEQAVDAGAWDVADELAAYFSAEMLRIAAALYTWMDDIIGWRLENDGRGDASRTVEWLLGGVRRFDPSSGDLDRARGAIGNADGEAAKTAVELMRVRWASLHDVLVVWLQEMLSGIAVDFGETAVLTVVERAYENLWEQRYADWDDMAPAERLQLSVEGMRGHLSGMGRRGDVGILDEEDRYVMELDPCGSCGILRRGDPESGRAPYRPAGNQTPHAWTWGRTGVGWYSVHSPIVMEYLFMQRGQPPLRPLENCDMDRPCRWFIYKDRAAARAEHYERMGFSPPQATVSRAES